MSTSKITRPRSIRLEASTACQLKCPSCPTATGEVGKTLGTGFLKLKDFQRLIDENPLVASIELSNWGEMFLNPELVEIMAYAFKRNVALYAHNGVNLNRSSDEVLRALVEYRFRGLTCSIDGASQETYSAYRVGGDFGQVIEHLETINRYKAVYRSNYPRLHWQFIAFGHNEQEIDQARKMAASLCMSFHVKLAWEDLYSDSFSPVQNAELIRKQTGLGVATREEYREKFGRDYVVRDCCMNMWNAPQISYDGRVLGCSINYYSDYGNAFTDGLIESLNSEKIIHARLMLMGLGDERPDIPCHECKIYKEIKRSGSWIRSEELGQNRPRSRPFIMLENKILGYGPTNALAEIVSKVRRLPRKGRSLLRGTMARISHSGLVSMARICARSSTQLLSGTHSLELPLAPDDETGWQPYPIFRGPTLGMQMLSCHASVLSPGHCPHPPHEHEDEELLLLLDGEVEIEIAKEELDRRPLRPGQFVYYPAHFAHTLRTTSTAPACYVMFKWRAQPNGGVDALSIGQFEMLDSTCGATANEDFSTRFVFEGATDYLRRLSCHTSTLQPGKGYDEHIDGYDVAIVVLEGEVETLGERVGPFGVIYNAAGMPHGMRNPGQVIARYIVFEFKGRRKAYLRRLGAVISAYVSKHFK